MFDIFKSTPAPGAIEIDLTKHGTVYMFGISPCHSDGKRVSRSEKFRFYRIQRGARKGQYCNLFVFIQTSLNTTYNARKDISQ